MKTINHFNKVTGMEIYDTINQKKVILAEVAENVLIIFDPDTMKKKPVPPESCRIIVDNELQMTFMDIPPTMAVKEVIKYKQMGNITPAIFLKQLYDIVYPMIGVNHEFMLENRKNRKRRYTVTRQIVMACFYVVFENNIEYPVSLSDAGEIYRKDHATVLHAIKSINALLETDRLFRERYIKVWQLVRSSTSSRKLNFDKCNLTD